MGAPAPAHTYKVTRCEHKVGPAGTQKRTTDTWGAGMFARAGGREGTYPVGPFSQARYPISDDPLPFAATRSPGFLHAQRRAFQAADAGFRNAYVRPLRQGSVHLPQRRPRGH